MNQSDVRARAYQMIELYRDGLKQEEIAKQFGCKQETVSYAIRNYGRSRIKVIKTENRHNRHTRAYRLAKTMYADGFSWEQIAKSLGYRNVASLKRQLQLLASHRDLPQLKTWERKGG